MVVEAMKVVDQTQDHGNLLQSSLVKKYMGIFLNICKFLNRAKKKKYLDDDLSSFHGSCMSNEEVSYILENRATLNYSTNLLSLHCIGMYVLFH